MTAANAPRSEPADPSTTNDRIRARADSLGAKLGRAFTDVVSRVPGAPLGPKLLAERYELTIGTASRFLRSIAESTPIDVLLDIPGPVPLRRFLAAVSRSGLPAMLVDQAESAVDDFEEFIRQFGGNRSGLNSVLAQWQPKGRKQFVLSRRQAVYKALAQLNGISAAHWSASFVVHPGSDDEHLDVLKIHGHLGLARSRADSTMYFGHRVHTPDNAITPDRPLPRTLDGASAFDNLHSVRLDEFCAGSPAPIETIDVGDQVIHLLGPTEVSPGTSSDLVLAEVYRPGMRRRGPGYSSDPLNVFAIAATPCQKLTFDLLIHEEAVPDGRAELLVYTTVPRGPAAVGDPARRHDLVQIHETLEIRSAGLDGLHLPEFPRYLDVLEHSCRKLAWDSRRFSSWRLQVDFPPPGMQFCIRLNCGTTASGSAMPSS